MEAELQKLKDIHLPPILPNWVIWLGCSFLFLILLILACVWRNQYKKKLTARFALARLKQLQAERSSDKNIALEISQLIRRTALHYFGRNKIAGLSGQDWLNFLNESGKTTRFTEMGGQLLLDAPYQQYHSADLTPLFNMTHDWLKIISKTRPEKK